MKNRPLIGIITARVAAPEQKQLLEGLLQEAAQLEMDVVVLSNIYNFDTYFAGTEVENRIYELARSPRIDGLIVTADCFLYHDLRSYVDSLIQNSTVPVVVIGSIYEGKDCINTDVRADFEEIAKHVLHVHHFTDIDILTGQQEYETSRLRVEGVRRVYAAQGIYISDANIIYGNYWMNTGEDLANDYLSGKRRMPQAVICTNDYMAFGVLDILLENGVHVPEQISVFGYEFIGMRTIHAPTLTTFLRNRVAIGRQASALLYSRLTGTPCQMHSSSGRMILGDTCPCGADRTELDMELKNARKMQFFLQLSFQSNFEQQLTIARSVSDYVRVLQQFTYLIREVDGVWLCLHADWCEQEPDSSASAPMLCYRVISPENGADEPVFFRRDQLFPETLPGSTSVQNLFFAPIFFAGKEMGHFILQYRKADSYDMVFGDWLKVAANGLESIRLKNDIRVLLECQNLSRFHDTATGLYNRVGFSNEIEHDVGDSSDGNTVLLALIRTSLFMDHSSIDSKGISMRIDSQIADALKRLTDAEHTFSAKLAENLFGVAYVGEETAEDAAVLKDKLCTLILHSPLYQEQYGLHTFACVTGLLTVPDTTGQGEALYQALEQEIERMDEIRRRPGFAEYDALRTSMYRKPYLKWDAQESCRNFHLSYGHFRATYKELFDISYHQDVIQSRISLAKALLLTTTLSVQSIAFQCGYEDDKYFLRQFRKLTGITPNFYRRRRWGAPTGEWGAPTGETHTESFG